MQSDNKLETGGVVWTAPRTTKDVNDLQANRQHWKETS